MADQPDAAVLASGFGHTVERRFENRRNGALFQFEGSCDVSRYVRRQNVGTPFRSSVFSFGFDSVIPVLSVAHCNVRLPFHFARKPREKQKTGTYAPIFFTYPIFTFVFPSSMTNSDTVPEQVRGIFFPKASSKTFPTGQRIFDCISLRFFE